MKYVCSLIVVEDVNKSRFLYETLLGQEVESDFGENVAFKGGFAIHQKEHFNTLIAGRKVGQVANTHELYFEHNELHEIERVLIDNDFEFVHLTVEQPWKQRCLRFLDYDNHIIEIGEKLEYTAFRLHEEGTPIADICKFTYLTEDQVKAAVSEYTKGDGR